MTTIDFNVGTSKFTDVFREKLCISELNKGTEQTVFLGAGGYEFKLQEIEIKSEGFLCEFGNKDLTRFPARIKSLATFLAEIKAYGTYKISHHSGECSVQKSVL
ncbi:MAG: hypothetical protein GY928_33025 [Colwellia sp.]|nr:hypothetical protein [Colwellia sp.]